MPILETQEAVDKAIDALRAYQKARKAQEIAANFTNDKLSALKSITGITGNDAKVLEEQVLMLLGQVQLNGLPEQRGR